MKIVALLAVLLLGGTLSEASEIKRQDLPSSAENISATAVEKEQVEEIEEKPIPGETQKHLLSFNAKQFYKDHFSIILGVSQEWDSNIFLEESDEFDDFITVVNPDVTMHFQNDWGYSEIEWIGRYSYFLDSDEITQSNSLSALGFVRPNDRLALGTRVSFEFTDDSEVATVFGDRILLLGYDLISVQPQVKYRLSKRWVADLSYTYDDIGVDDPDLDDDVDRRAHGFGSNLEFEVASTLFLTAGYGFRDTGYLEEEIKDSFSHLISGGLRKKFPSLFNVDFKATFHDKDFDEAQDDTNVDLSAGITSTFSRYTTLIFSTAYGLQESSRGEFTQYTSTRFSFVLQHYLTPKTVLSLRASYELQSFDGEDILVTFLAGDQDTKLYYASVGVRRSLLDWLSVEAGYSYQERDTDFEAENLQDHIVKTGVKIYV